VKTYLNFADIEEEVKAKAPPVVYKYRHWENDFHKSILTENLIWFAHPKDLNDPYDIRVPVRFNFDEVDHPIFFERLKYHAQSRFPHLHPDSRDFKVICENQFDIIKANPKAHFEKNYKEIREGVLYDSIGVFSLSKDPLNETMWAHYGNNSKGFCVGFDTIALSKELDMAFGHVHYDDQPPLHSFIKPIDENQKNEIFLKHTNWKYEEEFRIITLRIKNEADRKVLFNQSIIKEVIVGANMQN